MGTVINYLEKYGKYTFQEMPMTEVDSLALCQLSYLKFDGMVPDMEGDKPAVTLRSLETHPDHENLFGDIRYEKENRALFAGMLGGRRFQDMKLNYYVNVIEERWETQFSAVTFFLDDGTTYVAFRGTDETIVGWKEDFNMAFLSPVPGQEYSVRYLEDVAARFAGDFYVGGHSKGGNLAVYSSMNCAPETQERIRQIYSMDGPGFRPEVLKRCGYDRIAGRVTKILPHSSLVGMIFESDMYFQVVKSKTFGLLQHDPYTWLVVSNHLVRANGLYERRKNMDNTLNEWILSLNEQQLRTFVDTMYQVITASQAKNLIDFTAEWKRSMNGIIGALKEVDEETKQILIEVVKSLFEIARENKRKQASEKTEAVLKRIASRQKEYSASSQKEHSASGQIEHSVLSHKEHSAPSQKKHSAPSQKEHSALSQKEHSALSHKEHSAPGQKKHSVLNQKEHNALSHKEHSPLSHKEHSAPSQKGHSAFNQKEPSASSYKEYIASSHKEPSAPKQKEPRKAAEEQGAQICLGEAVGNAEE